jgi:hypothetical protein
MPSPHSPVPLPPHQQLVALGKWPVVGERAALTPKGPWRVKCCGEVELELNYSLEELQNIAQVTRSIDIHCVTRWSRLGVEFSGVPLSVILDQCRPLSSARFVSFVAYSDRDHSTSLPLSVVREADLLIAFAADGQPLSPEHGGPVRIVTPGRYFYKSLKWLARIELRTDDRLGYWEANAGYHNAADPWKEERFLAADLDLYTVRELVATRDFSGRDLRGLLVSGMDLRGLKAVGAKLRDAHFEGANLHDSCFDGANLSGAHLERADLRGATFGPDAHGVAADLEGADFHEADLRGARFLGASLFGATFGAIDPGNGTAAPAIIDGTTVIDRVALASLESTPVQLQFFRSASIRHVADSADE